MLLPGVASSGGHGGQAHWLRRPRPCPVSRARSRPHQNLAALWPTTARYMSTANPALVSTCVLDCATHILLITVQSRTWVQNESTPCCDCILCRQRQSLLRSGWRCTEVRAETALPPLAAAPVAQVRQHPADRACLRQPDARRCTSLQLLGCASQGTPASCRLCTNRVNAALVGRPVLQPFYCVSEAKVATN